MQGLENFETGSPILRSDGIREICLVLGVDCCFGAAGVRGWGDGSGASVWQVIF